MNNRGLNQKVSLSAAESEGFSFTQDQWVALTTALSLEAESTPDEVIAEVAAVVEKSQQESNTEVAASSPLEDAERKELQARAERGDQAIALMNQRDAEELVTGAVKAGKILAAHKRSWIEDALRDYDATKIALSGIPAGRIPTSEKGRGGSDSGRDSGEAQRRWVR